MQRLFIGLEGDGGVSLGSERKVTEDVALSFYVKLYEVLNGEGGKKRGRRASGTTTDGDAHAEETSESEG